MEAGRTTTGLSARSRSMSPPALSSLSSPEGTATPTPTLTRFNGENHGTSLSPCALQREEVGRHRRRLSVHPRLVRRVQENHRRLPASGAAASCGGRLHGRD